MQESWRAECAGTRTASTTGVTVLSESSLQPLVAGNQKVCLAGLCRSAHSVTHGPLPGVVLYCSALRHLKEHPGWGPTLRSAPQACDGPASVSSSCQRWPVGGERLRGWLHPLPETQQHCLASVAARLSSAGISHHDLLPHTPLCSQEQPSPWDCSTIPGDLRPCPGCVWLQRGLSDSHSVRAATEQLSHSQP